MASVAKSILLSSGAVAIVLGGLARVSYAGGDPVDATPFVFVPPVLFETGVSGVSATGGGSEAAGETGAAGGQPVGQPTGRVSGTASDSSTDAIVGGLAEVTAFCDAIGGSEYQVDCLADGLATVAASLPATGDYAEAKQVLGGLSRSLNDLAEANASTTLPSGVARVPGGDRSSRPLTPVASAAVARTNAAAAAIIAEAETVLLRSATEAGAKQIAYSRIAEAIGSNKVLLRSA